MTLDSVFFITSLTEINYSLKESLKLKAIYSKFYAEYSSSLCICSISEQVRNASDPESIIIDMRNGVATDDSVGKFFYSDLRDNLIRKELQFEDCFLEFQDKKNKLVENLIKYVDLMCLFFEDEIQKESEIFFRLEDSKTELGRLIKLRDDLKLEFLSKDPFSFTETRFKLLKLKDHITKLQRNLTKDSSKYYFYLAKIKLKS
jgi:hypothetical protein